jgi:glutathione synthase/RimK-type ligase-like ATP-grasp enzyme
VVGVPGNRRVAMFAEAVRAAGLGDPVVVPWREVLASVDGRSLALPPGCLVRVDSPGEDEAVDRLLRGKALGGGWAPTRVEGGAAWYAGFHRGLHLLADAVAATPGCRLLADLDEIAVMFDKRLTHARLLAAGVPVPPVLYQSTSGVSGWEELRQLLHEQRLPRVFVKPVHGSSASGVVALELGPGGRATATTSAQLTAAVDGSVELHNSLRVRRYREESELRALFGALAAEPLHVERWLPKATQGGRAADLRVVVTAGRATHLVVRTSAHPMTNLHLGGSRGDVAELRDSVGARWAALLETAEQAAACFPGSPSVGVDILPATGWQRFRVGEVNAFGDLLPGLTGLPGSGAEGLDTYAAYVAAVTASSPHRITTPGSTSPSTTTHRELSPCP